MGVVEVTVQQSSDQDNFCLSQSSCTNSASAASNIGGGDNNKQVNQELYQQNLCLHSSTCTNTGSVSGESGSNTQTNTCFDGSSCNNTGDNNKTICIGSANCENKGSDTKVISKGQDCSSGDPGSITVCANGRSVTS